MTASAPPTPPQPPAPAAPAAPPPNRARRVLIVLAILLGFLTVYAHNEENLVQTGMRVAPGDPIATIGRTGRATAHHLHFEIRRNGAVYNPLYLLPLPARVGQVDLSEESEEEHE